MTESTRVTALVVVFLFGLPKVVAAQYNQELTRGARVRVSIRAPAMPAGGEMRPGARLVGALESVDHDSIIVSQHNGSIRRALPVASLSEVEVSTGRERGKAALQGLLIGGAAGAGIAAILCSDCRTGSENWYGFAVLVSAATAGLTGTLLGAAIGRERWQSVLVARNNMLFSHGENRSLVLRWSVPVW